MQTAVLRATHTTASPPQAHGLFWGEDAVSQEARRITAAEMITARFRHSEATDRHGFGASHAREQHLEGHLHPAAQALLQRASPISLALIIYSQSPAGSTLSVSSLC